ncbi:MAG: porin [Pirellulaceae bacterium]
MTQRKPRFRPWRASLLVTACLAILSSTHELLAQQQPTLRREPIQPVAYEPVPQESVLYESGPPMHPGMGVPHQSMGAPNCGGGLLGCDPCTPMLGCCPDDQFFIKGWLAQGFTGNPNNGDSGINGPLKFNDQANEYMLNQLYLAAGRNVVTDPCCWDIGGRVDLLYGTDHYWVQSLGLETNTDGSPRWNSPDDARFGDASLYGLAMPQAYVEMNVPILNGVRVKAGHFYSPMGYESAMAPENFFYSRSYAREYGEPFTHTGILASWDSSPCMTWFGGMTRGWDTWEQPNGQAGFLGGFQWVSPHEATKLGFTLHTGNEDPEGENNRTAYSLVFQQKLNNCFTYVLSHNLGVEQNARVTTDDELGSATWYGLAHYLYYTQNPCLDYGLRFEWFSDQDNARVFGLSNENIVDGGNYYSATLGANWHPESWLIVRPEMRWDWADLEAFGDFNAFRGGDANNQFTIGLDAILMF